MKGLSDRLFPIFSNPRFLAMEGLGNEEPIFIQPYPVSAEDQVSREINSLVSRLRNQGISVCHVDLFRLLVEELEEDGALPTLLEEEGEYDRKELFETLQNFAAPTDRIVPRLKLSMESDGIRLTMVTGAGHVYPWLRTHKFLDTLQPSMVGHPVILFFPGDYRQVAGLGSKLSLFGSQNSNGYYRAFNLDQYRLPQ